MTIISRGRFQTSDDISLSYLETGKGPPLLLLPGWTMPASVWEPQLAGLSDQFRVIALDPRGHGESEATDNGQYTERRAQDIHEAIKALQLDGVVLAGWSMAGGEVLSFVDQFGADDVRGLILVDCFVQVPKEMWEQSFQFARAFLRDRESWTRAFVDMIAPKEADAAARAALVAESLRMSDHAAYSLLLDYYFTDSTAALATYSKPLLYAYCPLVAGQDAIIRSHAPQVQCVPFEDAGHMLFISHADKSNAMLRDFVDGI